LKRKITLTKEKKIKRMRTKKKTMHYKRKITWRVKLKRKITLTKEKNQKNEDKKKKNNAL
jgi:hypothetical protein